MPYIGTAPSSELANADLNGQELILDVDADTSIHASTDDQIDFKISGADDFRMTANTLSVLSGTTLNIDSGATITNSGTANNFGVALANDGNNRVVTGTGSGGLNGEANLSFDGTTLAVTGTVEPSGDTAAGDNAAIGYTAGEGLILTGQGSTDDITIKNDADTTVLNVATGGTDVEISAGNLLFGTGSKGVYLGVTSATAANLLDDYEEGTFTPVLGYYSGSAPTITYTSQAGYYTKIGRMVLLECSISTSEHTGNASYVLIQGLPFDFSSSTLGGAGSVRWEQMGISDAFGAIPSVADGTDNVEPVMYNGGTDGILMGCYRNDDTTNYVLGSDIPDSTNNVSVSVLYQGI